jgi:ERCC4-related helicase
VILKTLVDEHPLFRLKSFGYEGFIHQAELFYRLASRSPIKALVADEVGLGKTIEALMLVEWGLRKQIFSNSRVLILVPRCLLGQWVEEARRMGLRAESDLKHIDELMQEEPRGFRVFIFKIDTAKKPRYLEKLRKYKWDLIVVDEAHKLSVDSHRLKLVKKLVEANPDASIILLSATPHRGREEDYLELLELLGQAEVLSKIKAKEDWLRKYFKKTLNAIVFRRSKKEVNEFYEWGDRGGEKVFVDAIAAPYNVELTEIEKTYIDKLDEITRKIVRRAPNEGLKRSLGLVAMVIDKRGLSSPRAGWKTFSKIVESVTRSTKLTREGEEQDELLEEYVEEEHVGLDKDKQSVTKELDDVLSSATNSVISVREDIRKIIGDLVKDLDYLEDLAHEVEGRDSKLLELKEILLKHLGEGDKVVVFTEFADTAEYIFERLRDTIAHNYEIELLTGRRLGAGVTVEYIQEWLAKPGPRVLISTDVAAEGLNLQYANVVINYELPWSLVKLEQRAGRVWRLGQRRDVRVYLMFMGHGFEDRIFKALYLKLLNTVQAGIIPSILTALEVETERGRIALPISGVLESRSRDRGPLTPFNIWITYKDADNPEEGRRRIERLIDEYVKEFRTILTERLKELYSPSTRILGPAKSVEKGKLRKIIGLASRRELNEIICKLVSKMTGTKCSDRVISDWLIKLRQTEIPKGTTPLYLLCKGLSEKNPVVVVRACVPPEKYATCWVYVYDYHEDKVKIIRDLVDFIERCDVCEEVGKGLKSLIESELQDIKFTIEQKIRHFIKYEVMNYLSSDLREFIEFVADVTRRSSNSEVSVKSDLYVDVTPLVVFVPKILVESIEKKLLNEIVRSVDESIAIGDITEEKLEIEAKGRAFLEGALSEIYELTYIGDTKAPFDYIAKSRDGTTAFIELKTLIKSKFIVYTSNEKEFAERISGKHTYWLFVVEIKDDGVEIRGYKDPFNPSSKSKLKLIKSKEKDGKIYYIYDEVGTPDYFSTLQISH